MSTIRPFEIAILACALAAGIFLFVRVCLLSDAVPMEYRSASPGFNWGWEIDYERAMRDVGRYGEKPWPWPATKSGSRIVLPLNQPLFTEGLEITGDDGPIDQVTPEHILTFLNRLTEGNKPYTKRIRFSQLSSFFQFRTQQS